MGDGTGETPSPLREGVGGRGRARRMRAPSPQPPPARGGRSSMTIRRPDHRRRGRGPDRRCVQLEAGVVAVPPASSRDGQRGAVDLHVPRRAVPRLLQHAESGTDRRTPGVHPGADAALLRRWLEPLGPGDRRQAQSGDAAHGMDHRSATQGARQLLHPRRALPRSSACSRPTSTCSARPIPASASSCSARTGSAAISGRASCAARRPP